MQARRNARRVLTAALSGAALTMPVAPVLATTAGPAPASRSATPGVIDVRTAARAQAAARAATAPPATATARSALVRRLGSQAVLQVDPLTGAVRSLQRLDGALTAPSSDTAPTVARRFVSDNAAALGLDRGDLSGVRATSTVTGAGGLQVVELRQEVDGIPSFDGEVRVGVDRANRVISVTGAPRSRLAVPDTTPALTAREALDRLQAAVGKRREMPVLTGPAGRTQATVFGTRRGSRDLARLVLFGAQRPRLAWHVTYRASSTEWWDAVLDADTGDVLYRQNLVKSAVNVSINPNHPGSTSGGGTQTVDIAPWLTDGNSATDLFGFNAWTWTDVNDNDAPDAGEVVDPIPAPAPFSAASTTSASGACTTAQPCFWNHQNLNSWDTGDRRRQAGVQAFWFVNHFHDHLASASIGFNEASGNFQFTNNGNDTDEDPVLVHALDGAALNGQTSNPSALDPESAHLDNANMATPPDGLAPIMQMYLWFHGAGSPFRDVDGGQDAAVVYHEYTHGLSSRLITNADGSAALSSAQAGAMGEAWSDWYAFDLLEREGHEVDTPGTDGDLTLGRYVDATPNSIRSQHLDCSVGSTSAACPRPPTAGGGTGGYTYADFGKIDSSGPEVHADGEIWAQTLWQLRQALPSSDYAEMVVTNAMRLSPPEPSFLDQRNAILSADQALSAGANAAEIWGVFAERGMGYYASALDGGDTKPVANFDLPPAADAPRGTISGRVTDVDSAAPVVGATVAPAGVPNDSVPPATTDADGRYSMTVPAGTYPKIIVRAGKGYEPGQLANVTVTAGQTTSGDAQVRRNWAALAAGAKRAATNDDTSAAFGCGADGAVDGTLGVGWSPWNPRSARGDKPAFRTDPPQLTMELSTAIGVTALGIDPSNNCGDDETATTRSYLLETSRDGSTWAPAVQGDELGLADRGRINARTPAGDAGQAVRFVRLTMLAPQSEGAGDSGSDFIDVSELAVYGRPVPAPQPPPVQQPPQESPPPSQPQPPVIIEPTPPAKPAISLTSRTGRRGRVTFKITCASTCRLSSKLVTDRTTARRMHRSVRTVATARRTLRKGSTTVTIKLTTRTLRAMRRYGLPSLKAMLTVTATDSGRGLGRRSVRVVVRR